MSYDAISRERVTARARDQRRRSRAAHPPHGERLARALAAGARRGGERRRRAHGLPDVLPGRARARGFPRDGSGAVLPGARGTPDAQRPRPGDQDRRGDLHPSARPGRRGVLHLRGHATRSSTASPTASSIHLRQVDVRARKPAPELIVGALWFDEASGQLVRAAFRPSMPMDIKKFVEEEDSTAFEDVPRIREADDLPNGTHDLGDHRRVRAARAALVAAAARDDRRTDAHRLHARLRLVGAELQSSRA